jgi:ribosomal protein S1
MTKSNLTRNSFNCVCLYHPPPPLDDTMVSFRMIQNINLHKSPQFFLLITFSGIGMMMFVKDKNRERKLASRVVRTIPLTMRTPLSALTPGSKWTGTVISLTRFGAYVDIGTECDGLLHISQITSEKFVTNLQDYMTPGDEIEVTIHSINPQLKKLHLTLLPFLSKENSNPNDDTDTDNTDRIVLEDVDIDDELWGELIRVTDYGSYVELGAEVSGFLHFMDHPLYGAEPGAHPSTFMSVGERVRVWVADVDRDRRRIRVTANRPSHLPGPRREFR